MEKRIPKTEYICQHDACNKKYIHWESTAVKDRYAYCSLDCEETAIRSFTVMVGFTRSAFTTFDVEIQGSEDIEERIQDVLASGDFGEFRAFMSKTDPSLVWEYSKANSHIVKILPKGEIVEKPEGSIVGVD